jgi:hypothetical protein
MLKLLEPKSCTPKVVCVKLHERITEVTDAIAVELQPFLRLGLGIGCDSIVWRLPRGKYSHCTIFTPICTLGGKRFGEDHPWAWIGSSYTSFSYKIHVRVYTMYTCVHFRVFPVCIYMLITSRVSHEVHMTCVRAHVRSTCRVDTNMLCVSSKCSVCEEMCPCMLFACV